MRIVLLCLLAGSLFAQQQVDVKGINLFGWGQIEYEQPDNTSGKDGNFIVKKLRPGIKGNLVENLDYAFLYELAGTSPKLLQAWVDYRISNYLNFRLGQYKYPFGIENYITGTKWKFIRPSGITSAVSSKLGQAGGSLRDIGLQASGQAGVNDDFNLEYKVMVFNGNGINSSDLNKSKDVAGSVSFSLFKKLKLGASVYKGVFTNNDIDYDETALDFNLTFKSQFMNRDFHIQGEYITSEYDNAGGTTKYNGYYLFYTQYLIAKKLEAGIKYDWIENETVTGTTDKGMVTLALCYYIKGLQKVSLNYLHDGQDNSRNTLIFQFQIAFK